MEGKEGRKGPSYDANRWKKERKTKAPSPPLPRGGRHQKKRKKENPRTITTFIKATRGSKEGGRDTHL